MVVMQRELDRSVQRTLARVLWALGGLLVLCCAALLVSTQRLGHALQTVVDDRVQPLRDLHEVAHVLNVVLPQRIDPAAPSEGRPEAVAQAFARLDQPWQRYLKTWFTPEETELVRAAQRRLDELQRLLSAAPAAEERYRRTLQPLNAELAALLELQVNVAAQELAESRRFGRLALACGVVLSLLGLGLIAFAVQQLRQRVVLPLRVVADSVAELAAGRSLASPEALALSGDFAEVGEQLRRLRAVVAERASA